MDKNSFELLYKDAGNALGQNHLTDALTCIRGLLFNADSMELKNELESIRQDYGMMLAFMRQGGDDPQRDLIHRSLLNRASHTTSIRKPSAAWEACPTGILTA